MLARVRSLEARGVIKGYHADVHLSALDRKIEALVSLQLHTKTPEAIEVFLDAVWELEATLSITMLTGAFDFVVHITARDIPDLGDIVLRNFGHHPNVSAEQTAVIFDHRSKRIFGPLSDG